jgi:hypothetical protein
LAPDDTSSRASDIRDGIRSQQFFLPFNKAFLSRFANTSEKSIFWIISRFFVLRIDILIFLCDKSISMAWIYDTSKTFVINSKYIQAAFYEFKPEFSISVHVINDYLITRPLTIYKKTDMEMKAILKRLDELSKQHQDLARLPLAFVSIENQVKIQNQIRQINHESYECQNRLHDLNGNRYSDLRWKKIFQIFLSYLSDPNFHVSNNLYDFSEML